MEEGTNVVEMEADLAALLGDAKDAQHRDAFQGNAWMDTTI